MGRWGFSKALLKWWMTLLLSTCRHIHARFDNNLFPPFVSTRSPPQATPVKTTRSALIAITLPTHYRRSIGDRLVTFLSSASQPQMVHPWRCQLHACQSTNIVVVADDKQTKQVMARLQRVTVGAGFWGYGLRECSWLGVVVVWVMGCEWLVVLVVVAVVAVVADLVKRHHGPHPPLSTHLPLLNECSTARGEEGREGRSLSQPVSGCGHSVK